MTIRLTTHQMNKARTLAAINNRPVAMMVDLMKRRVARRIAKPEFSGSVARVQAYDIIAE